METGVVTSRDNRWVRLVRKISTPQGRESEGSFFVEGVRATREALAGGRVRVILVDEAQVQNPAIVDLMRTGTTPLVLVARSLFAEISDTATPQGVLAVVSSFGTPLTDLVARKPALVVVAAGLQDPGNLGALIRVADAVGAGAVIAASNTVDIFNPKVVRAAMGSHFHLELCRHVPEDLLITTLRQCGYQIVATAATGGVTHFDHIYSPPLAVVFGNEGQGLSPLWLESAAIVGIPMRGQAESLNVGVAAGVLLYEVLRQWRKETPASPCRFF